MKYNSKEDFLKKVDAKYSNEKEFIQAVDEVINSIWDFSHQN